MSIFVHNVFLIFSIFVYVQFFKIVNFLNLVSFEFDLKDFVPHLSAFFDTLRVLLVKLKAFLWAPKKDFTPLCSKGVKFFFATATFFFATANFFLPTVVSTSSKKKVAVPQAVLIVPTLQWSRCFANKKYVVSSYMKLTLIHGIWNRNEDFIIFC